MKAVSSEITRLFPLEACRRLRETLTISHQSGVVLLQLNGLKYFSSKNALNPKRPLSKKNTDTGVEKRIATLLPFVLCIRKHLQVITGVAVDVDEFKRLPNHFFGIFGNDPAYLSFMRLVLKIIEFTGPKDIINLICDDEEKTALPFYSMYRKVKMWLPEARGKMRFISFADDQFMFGLQAADFVSSIISHQVTKELKLIDYDYAPLFEALTQLPERYERLWTVEIAKGDRGTLRGIADKMKHQLNRANRCT